MRGEMPCIKQQSSMISNHTEAQKSNAFRHAVAETLLTSNVLAAHNSCSVINLVSNHTD